MDLEGEQGVTCCGLHTGWSPYVPVTVGIELVPAGCCQIIIIIFQKVGRWKCAFFGGKVKLIILCFHPSEPPISGRLVAVQ